MNLIENLAIDIMGGAGAPSGMPTRNEPWYMSYGFPIALLVIAVVIAAIFIFRARSLKNSELEEMITLSGSPKETRGSETSLIYMLAGRLHELSAEVKSDTDEGCKEIGNEGLYLVIPNPHLNEEQIVIRLDIYADFVLCFGECRSCYDAREDNLDEIATW